MISPRSDYARSAPMISYEVVDPQLWIDPAHLLWSGDFVFRAEVSDQKRGAGIVLFHGAEDGSSVRIGVAVAAEMSAGIVSADISGDVAGAFFAIVRVGRKEQVLSYGGLKDFLSHAAGAVCPGLFEFFGFSAGLDRHIVSSSDLHKCLRELKLGMEGYGSCFRKVPFYFFVQIDKADHGGVGTAGKSLAHRLKHIDMSFRGPAFVNEDRVISPAHIVGADNGGETKKGLHYKGFVRNVGFNVLPVRSDRHEPVPVIVFEKLCISQHRMRVLRTKDEKINDGGIQSIPGDGLRIEGIAHENKAFPQAVREPL